MSATDVIYICRHVGEYGSYYPEAVEAEGEYGGEAVAYVPRDLLTAMTAERDEWKLKAENYGTLANINNRGWDIERSMLLTITAERDALVDALNDYISDTAYGGNVEADTAETARAALALINKGATSN